MISGNERDHPRNAYEEVQRQLLPRDPIQLSEETRNSILLLACGVAGILTFIALSVLCWILYSKHPNNTFFWHALWALLSAGFSVNVTIWGWYARPAARPRDEPNHLWTVFNYIMAKILVVYLLVESIWLIFYLRIHFDYLAGLNTDPSLWEKRNYKGATFEDSWANSRKILWFSVLFSLIGCGLCAFFSYAIKFISPNPYRMAQISLYWVLGCSMLSAWLSIYWAEDSFEFEKFIQYRTSIHNLSTTIKAFGIVTLAVAGLSTVNHIFRIRIGYSISVYCFVLLVISLTGASGLVWRDVRNYQLKEQTYSDSTSCAFIMQTIHERDFHQDLCPVGGGHKYLNEGNVCSKHFMVTRWEGGDYNDIRFLNPMCCLTSKYFYIWPFMFLGFWSICLTVFVFIAATVSLQLRRTSEDRDNNQNTVTRGELLGAFLLLVLSTGWVIYFVARTKREVMMETAVGTQLNAYKYPDTTTLRRITPVPREVLSTANPATPFIWNNNPNGTVCFSYNQENMPFHIYYSNDSSCVNYSCLVRVALGSYSTKIVSKESKNISQSRIEYRNKFFPHCEGQFDDYITAYGRLEDVQTFLKELQFCTQNFTYMPKIAFYKEQVLSSEIEFSSPIPSQKYTFESSNLQQPDLTTLEPFVLKPQLCLSGFNQPKESCHLNFNCSYFNTTSSRVSFMTLKGRFYYLQEGQERFDSNPGVVARAYSGDKILGNDAYYLFENGEFAIRNIPFFRQSNYVFRLEIHDKSNVFLNKTVEFVLRPPKPSERFLSAGKIRLITKDSQLCRINGTDCQKNQQSLRGNVTVVVNDGSVGMATSSFVWPIEGAIVSIVSQHLVTGDPQSMKVTSRAGIVFFTNVPYGSYTVVVSKKGYTTESQFFDLQESHLHLRPFLVGSDYSDQDVKLSAAILAPSQDYDLILQFKTDEGLVCEVSPYFKYCGFAAHLNDVESGMGEENIHIRRLTVATYNAFLRLAPPYNSSCQSYGIMSGNQQQHSRELDWSHLQASNSCESAFCGIFRLSGVFYSVGKYVDQLSYYWDSSGRDIDEELIRLINFLGSPLFGTSIIYRSTSFVLEDQNVNQIMSDTTLGDELPPIVNPYPPLLNGNVPIWTPADGWNITNNTTEPNESPTVTNSTTVTNNSCTVVPQDAVNCTELAIFIPTAPPQSLKVVTRNYTLNSFPLLLVKESTTKGYLQNYSYYTEEQVNRTSGTDPSECNMTFNSTHENVTTSTFPFESSPRNSSSNYSSSKGITSNKCTNESLISNIDIATEKMVVLAGSNSTSVNYKRYDNHDNNWEIVDQNLSNSSLESNYSNGSSTFVNSEWLTKYVFEKPSNSSSWLNSSAERSLMFNSTDRNLTFYNNLSQILSNLTKEQNHTFERSNFTSVGFHNSSESGSNRTLRDEAYEFYYQGTQLDTYSINKLTNESSETIWKYTTSQAGTNCTGAGRYPLARLNLSTFYTQSNVQINNAEGIFVVLVYNRNSSDLLLYYPTTEEPRPSEMGKSEHNINNETIVNNGSSANNTGTNYYKTEYEIHPELLSYMYIDTWWYYFEYSAAAGNLYEDQGHVDIYTKVYNSSDASLEAIIEPRVNRTIFHSYQYKLWSAIDIYQKVDFNNITEYLNYTNGSRSTRNGYQLKVIFNPPYATNYPHNESLVRFVESSLIIWNENNEIIYARCNRTKTVTPKGSSTPSDVFTDYEIDPFDATDANATPDDLAPSTKYYGV